MWTLKLVINYGEGETTKWKNCVFETVCAPLPPPPIKTGYKSSGPTPSFKGWKHFAPSLQYG